MARAKARAGKTSGTPRAPRRSARNRQQDDASSDRVPDVFREMLAETASPADEEPPPLKKRKVDDVIDHAVPQPSSRPTAATTADQEDDDDGQDDDGPRVQTIIDKSETDDSEMDWEDVDLEQNHVDYLLQPLAADQAEEALEIEIGKDNTKNKPARARSKAATAAERAVRLHIHKMHTLCLLFNSHIRNAWCNDKQVQVCNRNDKRGRAVLTASVGFVEEIPKRTSQQPFHTGSQ